MREPFDEAEANERAWDAKCAMAPQCALCGDSVYPGEIYFEYEGQYICEKCLDAHCYDISELEV